MEIQYQTYMAVKYNYVRDLKTLIGKNWLNDKVWLLLFFSSLHFYCCLIFCSIQIIDSYVYLVMDQANRKAQNSVVSVSCFFYTTLSGSGREAVKHWIKVIWGHATSWKCEHYKYFLCVQEDIFKYSVMLIPVNVGAHWCLVVANLLDSEIKYFDSMGNDNFQCLQQIR